MTHFNLLVIGFGKAGKTLAKYAASQGQHVALVEQSSDNFGGTCINHGCIPSKVLWYCLFKKKRRSQRTK